MTERIQEVQPDLKQVYRFSDHVNVIIGILFFPVLLIIFYKGWPSLYTIFVLGLGLLLIVFILSFVALYFIRKSYEFNGYKLGQK